jgi:hypothetical protein
VAADLAWWNWKCHVQLAPRCRFRQASKVRALFPSSGMPLPITAEGLSRALHWQQLTLDMSVKTAHICMVSTGEASLAEDLETRTAARGFWVLGFRHN